jgi:Ran-binding protein 3
LDDTNEEEFEQEEDQEERCDNEEEEDKMVTSVSGSPPHETKMRQISEGVGGIKMIKQPAGSAIAVVLDRDAIVESEDVFVDAVEKQDDKLEVEPPHFVATITATDVSTSSLPEPQPLPQEAPTSDEDPEFLAPLQPFPSTSSGSSDPDSSFRRDSEPEDIEQEKMLKRKLGDRAVSESREAENGGKKASRKAVDDVASTTATGSKRSRDDGGKDANPREIKRPSPPPEKKEESSLLKNEKPTPIDSPEASTKPVSFVIILFVRSSSQV